jgi:hypothetical protein
MGSAKWPNGGRQGHPEAMMTDAVMAEDVHLQTDPVSSPSLQRTDLTKKSGEQTGNGQAAVG